MYVMSPSSSFVRLRENLRLLSKLCDSFPMSDAVPKMCLRKETHSLLSLLITLSIASSLGLLSAYSRLFASRYKFSAASCCCWLVGVGTIYHAWWWFMSIIHEVYAHWTKRHTCMFDPCFGSNELMSDDDDDDAEFVGLVSVPGARPMAISFWRLYSSMSGLMKSKSFLYFRRAACASSEIEVI